MGNLCMPIDATTRDINNRMEIDNAQNHMRKKLLFLGAGGAGKSTIFKQLKTIHSQPMQDAERESHVEAIRAEIVRSMKVLIRKSQEFYRINPTRYAACQMPESKSSETDEITIALDRVQTTPDDVRPDTQLVQYLSLLWSTDFIQETWNNREHFAIDECVKYFLDDIERVCDENYEPSEKDLLLARVRTTGIISANFEVQGHDFLVVDVGGQRNERKKWVNCFDDVTAVIFVASLSSYCEVLFEDERMNGMLESLAAFENVTNEKVFRTKDIILFLNKQDLFEEKIRSGKMLTHCFKDEYQGQIYDPYAEDGDENGTEDAYQRCLKDSLVFIQTQYSKLRDGGDAAVYIHLTTATDRANVKRVFWDVQNIVLRGALKKGHLL